MSSSTGHITLRDLQVNGVLAGLRQLSPGDPGQTVHEVVVADDIARLRMLHTNALIILTGRAAAGGWTVAGALRIAWERRAAALVAPEDACGPATEVLASRLGIALHTGLDTDLFDVALALAVEVGRPATLRDSRIAQTATLLSEQRTVPAIVRTLTQQLRTPVALTAGGQVLTGDASALDSAEGNDPVRVTVPGPDGGPWANLTAAVGSRDVTTLEETTTCLSLARAHLAAAAARGRLNSAHQIVREQVAFRRLRTAVRTSGKGRAATAPDTAADTGEPVVSLPDDVSDLGWHLNGDLVAVYLTNVAAPGEAPPLELSTLLTEEWRHRHPQTPLVVADDGWVTWLEVQKKQGPAHVARRLQQTLADEAGGHGISIGIGSKRRGPLGLVASVDEARLAARSGGPGSVTRFDKLRVSAVLTSLPAQDIRNAGRIALPDLFAARDFATLAVTLLAVLDHGGAFGQAAQHLGVHRNTVLARVTRARELGVPLDDPRQRLSLHVLLYTVVADLGS